MTGIVIVNYKTPELTIDFVRRELVKLKSPWRLVIVDSSGDESSARRIQNGTGAVRISLAASPPLAEATVYLISQSQNLGYARGNNLGAKFLAEHFPEIDYFLFSNNDIEIVDPDVVDRLCTVFDRPGVGAAAPHVDGPFGRQGPGWKRKSIWEETLIRLFYPVTWPLLRRIQNERNQPASSGFCYSTVGCFLLVSRKAFAACGGFDPATFLYAEEDILAERLLKCGYRYYYLEERRVIHRTGGVTMRFLTRSKSARLRLESQIYYYRTYRNASSIELVLYRFANRLFTEVTEVLVHRMKLLLLRLRSGQSR